MDSIEIARQTAVRLHAEAVARGLNPFNAYDFAVEEARFQGYTVEDMLPGSAMLDGGHAKILPNEQLILHEKKGSSFERALLVAHELGHAKLGDADDATPAKDVDFARPAEAAPVGEERVVDYGRRQRREIQMDLFARELLLPRPVVRNLHLLNGFSATAIAEKFGAPFDVVAQQLLDALLLPDVELPISQEQAERPLNREQKDAASHRGAAYLLEAGPGTGKTQTLVSRVEGLLEDGVDPRRILLLTFSNKAAGEMAERIGRKRPDAAAAMWTGTFHAFGLDLIRRFHSEIGFPKDPRMIDRAEAVELLEAEFPKLRLAHYQNLYDPTQVIYDLLSAISRAKDEIVGPEAYELLGQEMLKRATSPEEIEAAEKVVEVSRVYFSYEELKRERNCVDFGDLVWLPVMLLESNDTIRKQLEDTYDHVLVDEYQDVNRSSVRLISALRSTGKNLWVVGDAKQSIYRFRGASSFNVSRFGKVDFIGGQIGRLKVNYRTLAPIVTAYSNFARGMRVGGADAVLETSRTEPGFPPELLIAPGADEQTVVLAENIEALKASGVRYCDQVVLCTGNEKLSDLGQDLERLGVPVLFLGNLFERPEVRNLLSFLSICVDPRAMGLVRTACLADFQMSLSDVAAVLAHLRAAEASSCGLFGESVTLAELTDEGAQTIARLRAAFDGFGPHSQPWHVLATLLLDRTRMAAEVCSAATVSGRAEGIAIWQFMNFVRSQSGGQGQPIHRLLDRIRRLLRLGEDRDLRHLPSAAQNIDAVRLMTIHGSKGLEFDAVHLPGLNEDTLPGYWRGVPACPPPDGMIQGADGSTESVLKAARVDEQECLFYVAQSRARNHLFLYAASLNRGGRSRKLSEDFLQRMGTGLRKRAAIPKRVFPSAPSSAAIQISLSGGMRFDAHQLELYESCPRRFFYTHLLQTGGRRKATPFMQMHEAVRGVFQKIVSGELDSSDNEVISSVNQAFVNVGLADHGYREAYLEFALAMIRYFVGTRKLHSSEKPTALRLQIGAEEIFMMPDDVLIAPDGTRTLRRVVTGHGRKDDEKSVSAAAFLIAAKDSLPGARVELVYLADQKSRSVVLKAQELNTRSERLSASLSLIRTGSFPQNSSSRSCPNCPAFFVCGPVPAGSFSPIFRPSPVAP